MPPLSNDERRALALVAGLLVIAAGARWIERPQPLLDDVPTVDVAALQEDSRAARDAKSSRKPAAGARSPAAPAGGGAARGATPTASTGGATRGAVAATARLDPNTASADELTWLPGVGPALAARIIEERERQPFASTEDLRRVRGIGAALAARLADHVSLPAAPHTQPARPASPTRAGTPPATSPARSGAKAEAPIDLNRAGAAELETISGVGPALAGRLIARREALGRFRTWDDVDAVPGVGPALLAKLQAAAVIGS